MKLTQTRYGQEFFQTLTAVLLSSILAYSATANDSENTAPAQPTKRWYQVEVLIAKRLNPADSPTESVTTNAIYPEQLNQPNALVLSGDVVLIDDDDAAAPTYNVPFVTLAQEKRLLNGAARRLRNAARYEVLFHQAWPQHFVKYRNTPWIDINSEATVLDLPQLTGSINIQLKRFLHVSTQLALQALVPIADTLSTTNLPMDNLNDLLAQEANWLGLAPDVPVSTGVDSLGADKIDTKDSKALHTYTINQTRKMRSRKLHYIDHPHLAILVRIDPYDPDTGGVIPEP